jgi:DNA-binding LacI/PurR family transcriptional regulator
MATNGTVSNQILGLDLMRTPTIRDVARRAGVGIGTVSRVLNGSTQVREETRQRILAAIEELGFSPNVAARQLSGGKTWAIGVISPYFTNPSFVERLTGIQQVLDGTNYDLVLYSIRTEEQLKRRLQQIVTQNRVDGLIVLTLGSVEEQLLTYNPTIPAIMILEDRVEHYPYIMIDNHAGGQMAVEYLIHHDHTMIGYIGDELENSLHLYATRQRYEGFQAALAEAGLPWVMEWCCFGTHSQESAYRLSYELLCQEDRPTALVASSDTIAFGILAAARDLGMRVPQDIAVIGFDDIPQAALVGLTTIRQPLVEGAKLGTSRLVSWLMQGNLSEEEWQTVLPLEIVQRQTV